MLGKVLRKARRAAGLTQEEVAFKAGVDRSYFAEIESDKISPTVRNLFVIANALGVSAATIIGEAENSMKDRGPTKKRASKKR